MMAFTVSRDTEALNEEEVKARLDALNECLLIGMVQMREDQLEKEGFNAPYLIARRIVEKEITLGTYFDVDSLETYCYAVAFEPDEEIT